MSYSKYQTPGNVPYPGNDSLTLALAMPEEYPPVRITHVNDGNGPLCMDCRHCSDSDRPTAVARWTCTHPRLERYHDSSARYCLNTRWLETGRFCESFCGPRGEWFDDAET